MTNSATTKQISFIEHLLTHRATEKVNVEAVRTSIENGTLTRKNASLVIDMLLAAPKLAKAKAAKVEYVDPPVGMHVAADGTFFKVYQTRTSKQIVAKELIETADGHEFEYRGKRRLKGLSEDTRMTDAEAAAWSKLYGQCCNCLADLTDERSVLMGYGPVCAANNGWPYPTKAEAVEALGSLNAPEAVPF
jgi:hypothetical protein